MAKIRAEQLDTRLVPLAVWDGMPGDGPGGTASMIENWRSVGYKPLIINLAEFSERRMAVRLKNKSDRMSLPTQSSRFTSRVVTILFADVVGFSRLSEAEVPCFIENFLGAIARVSEKFKSKIITKNTWGDGLYFVFSDVDIGGTFALELAELVAETRWEEKGVRPNVSLRIALHAGPSYEFDDPITGSRTCGGTHVNRAARIEPITPPGQVYASEAFAALAAARNIKSFSCDYVGQTPMAKGYGTFPTYCVRRLAK